MCCTNIGQLEAAQQQLAEALKAAAGPHTEDEQQHQAGDLSSDGDHSRPSSSLGQHAQQVQEHADGHPSRPSGLAGSFTAALSNAASGFNLGVLKGDEQQQHEQPSAPRQQQSPSPSLSPFALARKFVADREADAVSRLKVGVCCMCVLKATMRCWGQVHVYTHVHAAQAQPVLDRL